MTRYNSSKYRVEPFINYIKGDKDKLNKFLGLFDVSVNHEPQNYFYGDSELVQKPTKEHLIKLVEYIGTKDCSKLKTKNSYRKKLYHGTPQERREMIDLAIKLINETYDDLPVNSRYWYIFEEFTHPDIFIEGFDYILVGEGKWTEKEITTKTTNLQTSNGEFRSQMIRHIQAALNSTNKRLYAFYIVDDECGRKYLGKLTHEALLEQMEKETIRLGDDEKKRIFEAFIGYTTWSKIKEIFPEVEFLSQKQIDELRNM